MAAYHQDFGGPLKDEDTDALLAYIASLRQTDLEKVVVRGSSARGAPLYAKKCASCHGQKGEGHTALSLDNPIFLATASDGYIRYAIEYGRPGTPMVGFGAKLSSGQIADLTAFIRGWSRNVDSSPVGGEDLPTPDQLILNPAGAAPRFSPLREGRYLPAKELHEALKSGARIVVLDARPPSDWIKSHIPGAYPAPYYSDGPELTTLLPRDGTWIVAYCGCPHAASGKVIDKLRAAGFVNTAVMDEGIFEWSRMKLPVTFGMSSFRCCVMVDDCGRASLLLLSQHFLGTRYGRQGVGPADVEGQMGDGLAELLRGHAVLDRPREVMSMTNR